eukprot:1102817_1
MDLDLDLEFVKSKNYTAPQMRLRAVYLHIVKQKTLPQIQEALGICVNSIKTYLRRWTATGSIYSDEEVKKHNNTKYKRPERRDKITPMCGALIQTLIGLNPCVTLDALSERLLDFGYVVCPSAIHYYLEDKNISYKVITLSQMKVIQFLGKYFGHRYSLCVPTTSN